MEDEPSPALPVGDGFGNRTRPKPNSRPGRGGRGELSFGAFYYRQKEKEDGRVNQQEAFALFCHFLLAKYKEQLILTTNNCSISYGKEISLKAKSLN